MSQHAGYARVAFNFGLSSFKVGLDQDEWRSHVDIKREFNAVKYDKFELKYKADRRGIPIDEAPQFFASSKTCSNCGHKKADLLLSQRTYHCTECSFECDRDLNAAINLCPA